MAGIFTNSPQNQIPYLNAPGKPTTILTGAGAQTTQLTVGRAYRFQAQGAPSYLGFGSTPSEATANSAVAVGEFIDAYDTKVFVITSATVAVVARQDAADTDVRIWECGAI